MRQYKRKTVLDSIKEQRLRDTVQSVKEGTYTSHAASKVFKISKTTLLRHLKSDSTDDSESVHRPKFKRVGNPFNLPEESEEQLPQCLTIMAQWGFGLTPSEICNYVKEYVEHKKKEHGKIDNYYTEI